jgi:hypothetical protein
MLKFGKFTLLAAMVLCAASAMASNFRGADQVYLPAAGFLQGSSGIFISDVFISNLSDEPVTVTVIFQGGPGGGAGEEFRNIAALNLQPRERKEFVNFLNTTLGKQSPTFGQLIFNACRTGQDCGTATQDPLTGVSPHFRNISVESRIYSIPAGTTLAQNPPTVGQAFAGLPWYSFVSRDAQTVGLHTVFITGLRQGSGPGTYRSNIGLVNASQFSSTTLTLRLFQGANTSAVAQITRTLGPLGHEQQNLTALFDPALATGQNLYITIEQTSVTPTNPSDPLCGDGCPAFFAYGSLLDNATSDAITLEAQFAIPLDDRALTCLYAPTANCKVARSIRRSVRH